MSAVPSASLDRSAVSFSLGRVALVILLLGGAIAGIAALAASRSEAKVPGKLQPLPVTTLRAERAGTYHLVRRFTGKLEATRSGGLGFEVGGRLAAVAVDTGAVVAADAVLARLDTSTIDAKIAAAEAERGAGAAVLAELVAGPREETIASARSSLKALESELSHLRVREERLAELVRSNLGAQAQLDAVTFAVAAQLARIEAQRKVVDELLAGTRKEQLDAQRAKVAGLAARVKTLQVERDKHLLRAPYALHVAGRLADDGAIVAPGQLIVRVLDAGPLEARVGVTIDVARTLRIGRDYDVEVGELGMRAKLARVHPEVDLRTNTVTVVLEVGREPKVLPGQTVRLRLDVPREESGFWLPMTALIRGRRGLWACFALRAVEGASVAERRELEVLHAETDRAYVRGTLRDGDIIVAEGAHRIASGQSVRDKGKP